MLMSCLGGAFGLGVSSPQSTPPLQSLHSVQRTPRLHDDRLIDDTEVRSRCCVEKRARRRRTDVDLAEIDAAFLRAIDDAPLEELREECRAAFPFDGHVEPAIRGAAAE